MNLDKRTKRTLLEVGFYLFIGILVLFFSTFAGFVLKGFSEPILTGQFNVQSYLGSQVLYIALLVMGLFIGLLFPIFNLIFIKEKEKPWTQDNPSWVRILTVSWLYNPEQSFIGFITRKSSAKTKNGKWLTNIVRVIFLATILFSIISVFQLFFPQLIVSGVPAQQFSETSDIVFGSVVPSFAENGALLFEIFLLGGVIAYLVARFVKDKSQREPIFWALALLLLPVIAGFSWMEFHSIVYGNSEAGQLATFVFGYVSTFILLVTGIFLWFFIGHFFNNLVLKLAQFVNSKSELAIIYGVFIFLIISLYAFFEYKTKKRKRKSEEQTLVG